MRGILYIETNKNTREGTKMTALEKGLAVAKEYAENSLWGNGRYEIYQNEWKKYGKHRIYISFSGFTSDGREEKNYKVGYVDVIADRFYKTI